MTLVNNLRPGDWVFLYGDLGAGKTFYTQKICKQMGVSDVVCSPTFALMHVYSANFNGIQKVLHLDLYRLKTPSEISSLGLEQEFDPNQTVVFIEWASMLDDSDWENFFQFTGCQKPNRIHHIHVTNFKHV